MTVASRLDELADGLQREVRHAVGARSDAELASAFDTMTRELNDVASDLETYRAVVAGPSPLTFDAAFVSKLAERRAWVQDQVKKLREKLVEDPMRVRQGKLWSDTRRAVTTLRNEVADAIDEAYARVLDPYRSDDRDILETLPPGTPGIVEYRSAIEEFDRAAAVRPTSAEDVTSAAAAGRRMQRLREQVETEAVPAEFVDQMRMLRTNGLPLVEMTDAFLAWLHERGLANSAVVVFGRR